MVWRVWYWLSELPGWISKLSQSTESFDTGTQRWYRITANQLELKHHMSGLGLRAGDACRQAGMGTLHGLYVCDKFKTLKCALDLNPYKQTHTHTHNHKPKQEPGSTEVWCRPSRERI